MYEIDTDVAIPPGRRRMPWRDMEVGDSFHVPVRHGEDVKKLQESMSANAAGARKRLGTRYTVRQENGGVRIWRIE